MTEKLLKPLAGGHPFISVRRDTCIDACKDMCLYTCIDTCIDACIDMCIDACIDTCIDRHVYRHVLAGGHADGSFCSSFLWNQSTPHTQTITQHCEWSIACVRFVRSKHR